jgi:glycerophosphoryl diester phosphodiesterase
MRFRWALGLLAVPAVLGFGYGIAVIRAEPVREHPFFARAAQHPLVIAHRGGMHLWPENTIYAFERALALGADVLEMDLHTTADGAIVVLHDSTVDRTTEGTGVVRDFTLERLTALDAGYRWSPDGGRSFPLRAQGLTIPTLEQVLLAFPEARLNLEIKQAAPSLVPQLCELVRSFRAQERVLVASFQEEAVHEFRVTCPGAATSATAREARRFVALKPLPSPPYIPPAKALQLPERLGRITVLSPSLIRAAHAANLQVHAFTINEPERMRRLLELGVDGIVTDRPDLMLELLGRGSAAEP